MTTFLLGNTTQKQKNTLPTTLTISAILATQAKKPFRQAPSQPSTF